MCSDRQNHTRMKIAVHAVTNAYSGNLWLYVNVRRFPVNGVAQYCRDELYRRSVFVNITYELPINRLLYRRIIEIQRCGRGLLSSLFLLCREISNCALNIASQPMIHVEDAFEIFHRYPIYFERQPGRASYEIQCIKTLDDVWIHHADLENPVYDRKRRKSIVLCRFFGNVVQDVIGYFSVPNTSRWNVRISPSRRTVRNKSRRLDVERSVWRAYFRYRSCSTRHTSCYSSTRQKRTNKRKRGSVCGLRMCI